MRPNHLYRLIVFLPILIVCVFFCSAGPVLAADYNSLVKQAHVQLKNKEYNEALATAMDAVSANANDFKGHYFVAVAYYGQGLFDDAAAAVNRALELAPQSAKPTVEEVAIAINASRQRVKAADEALAEGLVGKAARLYEEAWSDGQDHPDLGLKAADLYANRLSQPIVAARVLRQVSIAAKESPAADRAEVELAELAGTLRSLAEGHVANAGKQQDAEALQSLQLAEDADPTYIKIYELRAQLAAKGDSIEILQREIKALVQRDLAQLHRLAYLPRMAQWMQQPTFNEFLADLLGSSQVDQVRKMANDAGKPLDTIPGYINVPAGCFEANGKQVCLDAFRIGKYEVTQKQYKGVMGSNPSNFKNCGDRCPVEQVSWDDAQDFISRLNSQTGQRYRLPSEAEWEYACRGGGSNQYCGGDNIDAVAWYSRNSGSKTHPVGQKQPNSLGIYDMSGNVWEWVQDGYGPNYPSNVYNPTGTSDASNRVIRGGGWRHADEYARAAFRGGNSPGDHGNNLGFRLVAPIQ